MNAPFLEFYRANDISPVRQDVSDLDRHFSRRDHLYRKLGLPPFAFTDKWVLEFGCGSGHNALYVASRRPEVHMLVDGNRKALDEAQDIIPGSLLIYQEILEFEGPSLYDIVLCEGVIPHQENPAAFARYVGAFVAPGGVLIITVADYIGVVAEVLRRLIRDTLIDANAPLDEQLNVLRPVFASHAATLPGMSRSVDDWIIDTIIQPWPNPLFPMDEAIEALDDKFEVLGTSPQFLSDWRWYKDIHGDRADLNGRAIAQYRDNRIGLIDGLFLMRFPYKANNAKVAVLCRELFDEMRAIESGVAIMDRRHIAAKCRQLGNLAPHVKSQVNCAANYFEHGAPLDDFASWFGHGQQYISFVRKS